MPRVHGSHKDNSSRAFDEENGEDSMLAGQNIRVLVDLLALTCQNRGYPSGNRRLD